MPKPRISHTKTCRALLEKARQHNWCLGTGACGLYTCCEGKPYQAWRAEDESCHKRLSVRVHRWIRNTQHGDGKSAAAGETNA